MIYDIDKLDVVGKRKDGGVELYIISSERLDDSPETQTALLDKIENYLSYINSSAFKDDFGEIDQEKIQIILKLSEEPSEMIQVLCQKIALWVEENGAKFTTVVRH